MKRNAWKHVLLGLAKGLVVPEIQQQDRPQLAMQCKDNEVAQEGRPDAVIIRALCSAGS